MADQTPPLDTPAPLEPPPRASVDMTEAPIPDDPKQQAEESVVEDVFTDRLDLTDEEHDELAAFLDRVVDDILKTRSARGWEEAWDSYEDYYFGEAKETRPAGLSNLHVPLVQEIVDAADAVMEQVFFTAQPWLQVMPRERMDVSVMKRREQFLQYGLDVEMHAKERLDPVRWEAAVLGTGVVHLRYLKEMDRLRDQEVYDGLKPDEVNRFLQRYPAAQRDYPGAYRKLRAGKIVRLNVEFNEARHDAPYVEYVPLRDWLVRDTAEWDALHREQFVGHRFHLRWDELQAWEEDGYYDDVDRVKFRRNRETGDLDEVNDYTDKTHEIITGTVRWRRRGADRERRYLVDFHRESRAILRILRYPYWHNRVNYIPFYYQRNRKYIYGISLVQKIEYQQLEADAIHSLAIDSVSFAALPMFKARTGMEQTFNPLRDGMYPGKVYYSANPDSDIQQLTVTASGSLPVLMQLEELTRRHAELASGMTQSLSGLESAADPNAPASKTLQLIQQAMMRIGRYMATFGSSLVELGFQTLELYYQFSPKGKIFRVMGDQGIPVFPQITRQELRLRADLYPHGTTSALNPEKEKRDNLEALGLLLKEPTIAQSPLKRWAAWEMLFDSLGSGWAQKKHTFMPSAEELDMLRKKEQLRLVAEQQQFQSFMGQLQQAAQNPQLAQQLPQLIQQFLSSGQGTPPGGGNGAVPPSAAAPGAPAAAAVLRR